MSTVQILRAIHALPESEQWNLFARLGVKPKKAAARPRAAQQGTRSAFAWTDLHAWRQRTFGGRELPNPVLMDRDEAPF